MESMCVREMYTHDVRGVRPCVVNADNRYGPKGKLSWIQSLLHTDISSANLTVSGGLNFARVLFFEAFILALGCIDRKN